jgi:GxxExxY protein
MKTDVINNLTYKVIGLCYEIHNKLGNNYKEKYYQRALEEELTQYNIKYEKEKSFYLKYKEKIIGKHYIDFLIEEILLLELKTLPFMGKKEYQQTLMYLNSLQLKWGLLVNFRSKKVEIKRVVLPDRYLQSA